MPFTVNIDEQVDFGADGSSFGAYTAVTVAASAKVVIPVGWHYVVNDAHTTVEITQDSGTTFETVVAASAGGLIWSDGQNVSFVGDVTGGTGHRAQILGQ